MTAMQLQRAAARQAVLMLRNQPACTGPVMHKSPQACA